MLRKSDVQLIVGLGNPGTDYASHRHNVGQWLINMLCQEAKVQPIAQSKLQAQVTTIKIGDISLRLMTPMTYMNESGQAVQAVMHYYKLEPHQLLIVHDELDLLPGTARLKFGGGHGGHNGLRSILQHLSNADFWRLRVGIGHPGHKEQVSGYVLQKPTKIEQDLIEASLFKSLKILPLFLQGETEKAQTLLHTPS